MDDTDDVDACVNAVRHLGAGQVEGDVMFLFAAGVSATFTYPIHHVLMVSALKAFPIYFLCFKSRVFKG